MPRTRGRTVGLLLATTTVLAGCAGAGAAAPSWSPQPQYRVSTETPQAPGRNSTLPSQPGSGDPSQPGDPSTGGTSPAPPQDPQVVATKLNSPTGLTLLPDGTALVGERATGRIVRVQPVAGRPVTTVRTLTGLDARGGGGLLDLALSPTYDEDQLIFAYVTTPTDNEVLHFTLTGPATKVVTGIPKGGSDNTGRITFDAAGNLYIGTGDAGSPQLAANRASTAGKVLRVDDIGNPVTSNPAPGSKVFTSGHRTVDGLCFDPDTGAMFETEARAAGTSDEVNVLIKGGNYGWPTVTGTSESAAATLPAAAGSVGGCAVQSGRLYVTSRDGKSLQVAAIRGNNTNTPITLGPFSQVLGGKYGRLLTVVAAADGALWLTTTNKDGHASPVAADERVLRIIPSGGAAGNPSV